MKIYMSYWHTNHLNEYYLDQFKEFIKVSAQLIKKHYNQIHLITDFNGKKELENIIDWTSIDLQLETLPKEYSKIWNLGKLKAINLLSSKKEPFLHVDHDVFLTKKLPEDLINSNIILQSLDFYELYMEKDKFHLKCPQKCLASSIVSNKNYNCGIIGGKDFAFFEQFTSSALKLILSNENKNFWLDDNEKEYSFKYYSKAMLVEQYYIAVALEYFNKKPNLLYEKYFVDYRNINDGYVHFYGPDKNKYLEIFSSLRNITCKFF